LSSYDKKNISISKNPGKADDNLFTFPRKGWYNINAGNTTDYDISDIIGGPQGRISVFGVFCYTYDDILDTLTAIPRYRSETTDFSDKSFSHSVYVSDPDKFRCLVQIAVTVETGSIQSGTLAIDTDFGIYSER